MGMAWNEHEGFRVRCDEPGCGESAPAEPPPAGPACAARVPDGWKLTATKALCPGHAAGERVLGL